MERNFTLQENLIRNLYNETNVSESLSLMHLMENDVEIRQTYKSLEREKVQLDRAMAKPDPSSLRIIMEHSRKTQKLNTHV